jgi:hypothetical protein
MVPFVLTSKSVTLFPQGQPPLVVDASHTNFEAVVEAIRDRDFDKAVELGSVKAFVNKMTAGNVVISDDEVTYKGQPLTGYLVEKMMAFFREGMPVAHYCKFLDNLMSNPSMTSRKELYLFLEAADLPITPDGCFLAYKAVRSNYRDKHSGEFDNSPGSAHIMQRAEVDDDRTKTCSYGFHAAAYEYAKNFMSGDDRLVAVKINPADVVSVPSDYNNQKLRCSQYEVVFEVPEARDVLKDTLMHGDAFGDAASGDDDLLF